MYSVLDFMYTVDNRYPIVCASYSTVKFLGLEDTTAWSEMTHAIVCLFYRFSDILSLLLSVSQESVGNNSGFPIYSTPQYIQDF